MNQNILRKALKVDLNKYKLKDLSILNKYFFGLFEINFDHLINDKKL